MLLSKNFPTLPGRCVNVGRCWFSACFIISPWLSLIILIPTHSCNQSCLDACMNSKICESSTLNLDAKLSILPIMDGWLRNKADDSYDLKLMNHEWRSLMNIFTLLSILALVNITINCHPFANGFFWSHWAIWVSDRANATQQTCWQHGCQRLRSWENKLLKSRPLVSWMIINGKRDIQQLLKVANITQTESKCTESLQIQQPFKLCILNPGRAFAASAVRHLHHVVALLRKVLLMPPSKETTSSNLHFVLAELLK